uniref:Uncharacterized protein n=1 Tax=Octactis speculum TaxID=3111310 RepID=A0A7S2F7W3_9STRA|mmetsp:Transcript_16938/g.22783  ORF Transcript_16938/g.22783 Transcript_16938/m.22783 type:complete len:248 (+) Transcript_16938:339-1082(+)
MPKDMSPASVNPPSSSLHSSLRGAQTYGSNGASGTGIPSAISNAQVPPQRLPSSSHSSLRGANEPGSHGASGTVTSPSDQANLGKRAADAADGPVITWVREEKSVMEIEADSFGRAAVVYMLANDFKKKYQKHTTDEEFKDKILQYVLELKPSLRLSADAAAPEPRLNRTEFAEIGVSIRHLLAGTEPLNINADAAARNRFSKKIKDGYKAIKLAAQRRYERFLAYTTGRNIRSTGQDDDDDTAVST